MEERYERNERTAGGFGLSVTSNQIVIHFIDSLIKPRCPTVRFEVEDDSGLDHHHHHYHHHYLGRCRHWKLGRLAGRQTRYYCYGYRRSISKRRDPDHKDSYGLEGDIDDDSVEGVVVVVEEEEEEVENCDYRRFKKNKVLRRTKSVRLETYSNTMASAERRFLDQELKHLHPVSRKHLEGPYRRRVFFAQEHEVISNNTYAVETTSEKSGVKLWQRCGDIYVSHVDDVLNGVVNIGDVLISIDDKPIANVLVLNRVRVPFVMQLHPIDNQCSSYIKRTRLNDLEAYNIVNQHFV